MSEDWKRDELFMLFSKRTNRKDKESADFMNEKPALSLSVYIV
jgi:hypothetical protein